MCEVESGFTRERKRKITTWCVISGLRCAVCVWAMCKCFYYSRFLYFYYDDGKGLETKKADDSDPARGRFITYFTCNRQQQQQQQRRQKSSAVNSVAKRETKEDKDRRRHEEQQQQQQPREKLKWCGIIKGRGRWRERERSVRHLTCWLLAAPRWRHQLLTKWHSNYCHCRRGSVCSSSSSFFLSIRLHPTSQSDDLNARRLLTALCYSCRACVRARFSFDLCDFIPFPIVVSQTRQ